MRCGEPQTRSRREQLLARGQLPPPVINYGAAPTRTRESQARADGWKDGYQAALDDLQTIGVLDEQVKLYPLPPVKINRVES